MGTKAIVHCVFRAVESSNYTLNSLILMFFIGDRYNEPKPLHKGRGCIEYRQYCRIGR